jgi:LSD1 subclass zinc finger protein
MERLKIIMVKDRQRQRTIDALAALIVGGASSGLASQHSRPRSAPVKTPVERAAIRVLDIQQVQLTPTNRHRVSLLISDDEGTLLAMGVIGNLLGLSSSGASDEDDLDEQVIELVESDVFARGRRKWFECPGLPGKPCGTRRMKLYLPPGESAFACSACHAIMVPHTPDRPLRRRGRLLRQLVLHWRSPLQLTSRSA